MKTYNVAALSRSAGLCVLLAALSAMAVPALAAPTCTGVPRAKIDPLSQTVNETTAGVPTLVHLDGSSSTPANGNLTYAWQYLGSTPGTYAVTLLDANTATPTFLAPDVPSTGATLRFKLTVCGSSANATTTDINVADVVLNGPPTAVALASPASATEGTLVTLDGSGSFDPDPGTTLTYSWVQTGGSPTVTLTNANAEGSKVTFFAPNTPIETGASLSFHLTVSDGSLSSGDDQTVNIVWSNDPPVASLVCPGGVIVVDEGQPVTLDGSDSMDSDGTIAFYAWDQKAGTPNLGIGAETTDSLSFIAPSLGYNELGGVTLRLTVQDNTGASSSAECGVFINDVTAPVINVPADMTPEATSSAGANVSFSAFAQDAVDDEFPYALPASACSPASGSAFALDAATTVQCTAADSAHNAATASFTVTVGDTTAPSIDHTDAITAEATGPAGAVVDFALPATLDLVDGAGTASCIPAPGGTFALATTSVTCTATDAHHNTATSAFDVTVVDTTAPVIAPHDDVTVEATSALGALVSYALPSTSDLVDGEKTASCSPMSGTQFGLGKTTVACAAVDAAGNAADLTYFDVFVLDRTAPVIGPHGNLTAEATGPSGAAVGYASPVTTDAVDGPGSASCIPASGSTFAIGAHTVTCTAADAAGNVSTPTAFTITVSDTTAPTIAPHDDVSVTATANSGAVVDYTLPTATDLVDLTVPVTCAAASGTTFTVGTTTVNCSATDHAGNTANSSFKVIVSYSFSGFYRPVDNLPTVNVVKAGSAVPVKFSLGGNQGLNIFATGYPASVGNICGAAATDAIEETVTAGGSSLSYDAASGQYIYVWKTEKSWAGTCRQLQVKLRDGSTRSAAFNFAR